MGCSLYWKYISLLWLRCVVVVVKLCLTRRNGLLFPETIKCNGLEYHLSSGSNLEEGDRKMSQVIKTEDQWATSFRNSLRTLSLLMYSLPGRSKGGDSKDLKLATEIYVRRKLLLIPQRNPHLLSPQYSVIITKHTFTTTTTRQSMPQVYLLFASSHQLWI